MPTHEISREKHLDLIQGVVSRLANSSTVVKGWAVTLVTGLLLMVLEKGSGQAAPVLLLPVFAFWILDTVFLYSERLFRDLYSRAVDGQAKHGSLDISGDWNLKGIGGAVFASVNTVFYSVLSVLILIIAKLSSNGVLG